MSRLKSARAAKPAKTKSTRPTGGGRQVMVPTAKSDIYVTLLGVALGAIVVGSLFLALVMNRYGFSTKPVSTFAPSRTALA